MPTANYYVMRRVFFAYFSLYVRSALASALVFPETARIFVLAFRAKFPDRCLNTGSPLKVGGLRAWGIRALLFPMSHGKDSP